MLRQLAEVNFGDGAAALGAWRSFRSLPVVVWSGVLVLFYINVVNGVVGTFHPVLVLAAGLSLTQIGVLSSCRSWASSTVRLGSGPLFGRIGTAGLMTPLVLTSGLALFLIPSVKSIFLAQIPLFLAMGLARGLSVSPARPTRSSRSTRARPPW